MGWRMLDGLYRMTGDTRSAELAQRHFAHLAQPAAAVVQAKVLFDDGEIDAANADRRFLLEPAIIQRRCACWRRSAIAQCAR